MKWNNFAKYRRKYFYTKTERERKKERTTTKFANHLPAAKFVIYINSNLYCKILFLHLSFYNSRNSCEVLQLFKRKKTHQKPVIDTFVHRHRPSSIIWCIYTQILIFHFKFNFRQILWMNNVNDEVEQRRTIKKKNRVHDKCYRCMCE